MSVTEWGQAVRDAVTGVATRLGARLPDLLGALVLLLSGWLLARLVRAGLRRLLRGALDLRRGGRLLGADRHGLRRSLPELVGGLAFWVVLLVFGVAAVDTLGLPGVSELLATLARYLPQALAAVVIVLAGVAVGSLVHDAVAHATAVAGVAYGAGLARTAQAAVWVVAAVIGADQAGIESTFLMIALPVVLGAVLGGAALAFGLGSRTAVSNIIASYHLAQLYQVGQRIRIAGFEGRILHLTPTTVVLETGEGRVAVPAKLFGERVSVLLAPAGGER